MRIQHTGCGAPDWQPGAEAPVRVSLDLTVRFMGGVPVIACIGEGSKSQAHRPPHIQFARYLTSPFLGPRFKGPAHRPPRKLQFIT
ncbi:MAG: hypothetical protein N0E48_15610 [Candidatus Thiodiazotropha endolucinida]|nr:hypothetical protein [Candidatus Thiodiazotropha taylori]MCW4344760.1 hypothetical protein [Candidatus Thiodiazotropha endolucinida]